MNQRILSFLMALFCILELSAFPWDNDEEEKFESIPDAINDFGIYVFKKLNTNSSEENLVISPLSITTALTVVQNGAQGETKSAMKKTLNLTDFGDSQINNQYKKYITKFNQDGEEIETNLVNSLWYSNNFELNRDFLKRNQIYFNAKISHLNFSGSGAAQRINDWVEENTNGRIKNMVSRISPGAMLYVLNAIYFNGKWQIPFDKRLTEKMIFYGGDKEHEVPFMQGSDKFHFYKDAECKVLSLPYSNGHYSMVIVLPNQSGHINDLISNFSLQSWKDINKQMKGQRVEVHLPKFTYSYGEELNNILKDMGMEVAFDDRKADFSGISLNDKMYISNVIHKAFIEVNEEGTEVAAATSIEFKSVAATDGQTETFYANRPFVYFIYDKESHLIQFMGKVVNPGH